LKLPAGCFAGIPALPLLVRLYLVMYYLLTAAACRWSKLSVSD